MLKIAGLDFKCFLDKKYYLLYDLVKPNLFLIVLVIVLSIFVSILEIVLNALIFPLIQILSSSKPLNLQNLPLFSSIPFIGRIHTENLTINDQIKIIVVLFILCSLIKNLLLYASSININIFMLKTGNALRLKCLERFLSLKISYYNRTGLGQFINYVNEHAQRSEKIFSSLLELLRESLFVLFLIGFLLFLSPTLTIFSGALLFAVSYVVKFVFKKVALYSRKASLSLSHFSNLVSESFNGIRLVKSLSSEEVEFYKIKKSLDERYDSELTAYRYNSMTVPLIETLGIILLFSTILIGYSFNLTEIASDKFPVLFTYLFTLLRTLPRFNHLNGLRSNLFLLSGSLKIIDDFILNSYREELNDGSIPFKSFSKEIELSNISFTYPGNSELAIRKLSFNIPKGKVTAIVGKSGSGKSTIFDLILRFYDPDEGAVLVDGIDIRKLQLRSWHQSIGVVSQDVFLFNTTIRENITYGLNTVVTEERLFQAAKSASALDFIMDLPDGFETIVGNDGSLLSGGQKQRIALARAFLADPEILILDEATSALDNFSEQMVQKAIDEIRKDITVVIIAHRLSSIKNADKIIVLQEGSKIEQGSHQDLISQSGVYYSLYSKLS